MTRALPFQFGVVTDEISDDLRRAAEVAQSLGIPNLELNQLGDRNAVQLTDAQAREALDLIASHGLRCIAIDTPCFKSVELEPAASHCVGMIGSVREHLELLRRGIELAHVLGAPFVRLFSFRKLGMAGLGNPSPRLPCGGAIPPGTLMQIADGLRRAGDLAMRTAVTLVVENVRSCWGNTGTNLHRIVEATGHPRVRALWDPGNDFVSGGDPLQGYYAVRERAVHVHLKDARVVEAESGWTSWAAVGAGEVGCVAQLRALIANGYNGIVTLETHWRGDRLSAEQSTRESWRGLQEALTRANIN